MGQKTGKAKKTSTEVDLKGIHQDIPVLPFEATIYCTSGEYDERYLTYNLNDNTCTVLHKAAELSKEFAYYIPPNMIVLQQSSPYAINVVNMYTGEMIVQFTGIDHYHDRFKYIGNNILVTGGVDYTIRAWDLANKCSISCFKTIKPENEGYRNSLSCMGIQYLGGTTVMYENSIGTQEIFDIYKGHLRNMNITCFRDAFCVIDDRRLAGGLLNDVTIVDFHKGTIIAQMSGHERHISGTAYVGKEVLVSASHDATVRVWDLTTNACLRTIGKVYLSGINYSGHDLSDVRHIYGEYVAVGSGYMGEKNIKIWNIATGDLIKVLPLKSHVEYMDVYVVKQQPEWLQLLLTKNFSDLEVLCSGK